MVGCLSPSGTAIAGDTLQVIKQHPSITGWYATLVPVSE